MWWKKRTPKPEQTAELEGKEANEGVTPPGAETAINVRKESEAEVIARDFETRAKP